MAPIARRQFLTVVGGYIACARSQHARADSGNSNPKRFAIAVPAAADAPTAEGASWGDVAQGVAADLIASGRFVQIESDLSRQITNVDAPPDFKKWRSTRAEWLIVGRVTKPDDLLVVSFVLWDVANGQQMLNVAYRVDREHLRLVVHLLIAPAMIKHLSGEHDNSDGNQQK